MYYLVERYSDYDSVEFNVIEFSENRETLEEKAKRLNEECEKLQDVYDKVESLVESFNKSLWFFTSHLKLNNDEALGKALTVNPISEDLKQYVQISNGKMTYCKIMNNYPTYYVDQIKEPDIKL